MTLSGHSNTLSPAVVAAMLASMLVTVVISWLILSSFRQVLDAQVLSVSYTGSRTPVDVELGIVAEITAGGVTVTQQLSELSWSLGADQSLDTRLPAGPFRARCEIRFHRHKVGLAKVGATLRNASIIVWRDGEVLLADHVGDEPCTVLTSLPVELPTAIVHLTYQFESTGEGPCVVEAVWQPDGRATAAPLPVAVASRHAE